jgi:hypothetical protein
MSVLLQLESAADLKPYFRTVSSGDVPILTRQRSARALHRAKVHLPNWSRVDLDRTVRVAPGVAWRNSTRIEGLPMRNILQLPALTLLALPLSTVLTAQEIKLADFLSNHVSDEQVVNITTEPATIYVEDSRNSHTFNFDFILENQTDGELELKFLKVAAYDKEKNLVTYRYLNHNGVGTPGIHSLGNFKLKAREKTTLYNPFHSFPESMEIAYLRYMFTYADSNTGKEYYYGNIVITPVFYNQMVQLELPVKGTSTILDGHDYFSHHRRFSPTIVRDFTNQQLAGNFSRYALDFVLIGDNGSLRRLPDDELTSSYDFRVKDATNFYSDKSPVYSPADGVVVEMENMLDDLYDSRFDMGKAVETEQVKSIAGNYLVIKHNDREFSHLFHFLKDSIKVNKGQQVKAGQFLGLTGFSGAATTYSHLHYQLMGGQNFLTAESLPAKFTDVTLLLGKRKIHHAEVALDTGDIILN